MRQALALATVTLALLVYSTPANAQGVDTSTVTGTITDATGGVVADVAIVLQSASLIGGPRRVTTDRSGEYRISNLTGGIYELSASAPGFRTSQRADIRLPGERTLTVDVRLDLAAIGESVGVRATAPLLDVRNSASPVVLDHDLIENLPTDRVLSNMMNLTPGVNLSAGLGGTQSSNPIYVDGVSFTTDAQQLSPRFTFNVNWIEEIQIVALGANAEYGDFSGVVQVSTLKSGGNRLSGLAEYRMTEPKWVGTNTSSLSDAVRSGFMTPSQRTVAWHDASAQIGGPIVADRLWYFAGFQHFTDNRRPALVVGSDSVDERDRRTLVKVTAAPGAAWRLEGFHEFDRYHLSHDGLAPNVRVEATTNDTLPNYSWSARAMRTFGDRTSLELRNGGFAGTYAFDPPPPGTRSGPPGHLDLATGVWYGNASDYWDFGSSRSVTAAMLNHYTGAQRSGRHDVKVGAEFERARQDSVHGYPGGRLFLDMNGQPFRVQLQNEYAQSATIHRTAAYAQDAWAATDRLTLQVGARVAFNRGLVSQGGVLSTKPVDPRAGAAWDVIGDHKTVVRAHAGRYHDASLTAHFQAVDAAPLPPLVTASVVGADQFVEVSRTTTSNNVSIDPAISNAYFDQYVVGVERALAAHWAVSAQGIRRNYRDLVGMLDTGSVYEPGQRRDPGPDGRLGTGDDGGFITVFRNTNAATAVYSLTNLPGAYRRYSALQFIARKQYANRWQLQASYAWSSTRGNVDNSARSNAGGPEVGSTGVFGDPNRLINADGPSPFDSTHEVKALATWRLPLLGGVNISGVYRYHSGMAWARTALAGQLGSLQFVTFGVRVEPRGSRRTDALSQLDLRAEKTVTLRGSRRLGLVADVFNINNQGIPDPGKLFAVEFRSGPTFGQPLSWVAPRTLRAGVRFAF